MSLTNLASVMREPVSLLLTDISFFSIGPLGVEIVNLCHTQIIFRLSIQFLLKSLSGEFYYNFYKFLLQIMKRNDFLKKILNIER